MIIGVSHGSLDHIKGQRLFKILNIKQFYFFYFTYILIAISVIIIWILKPSISLLLFLIIASYHFGKEDTQFLINKHSILNICLYFFKGLLIVLAPLFFHFNETVNIFKFLLVENEAFSFNFHLFKKGGGLLESERLDIPLLAEIPYSEDLMLSIDKGEPLVQSNSKHSISKIFIKIAQSLVKQYE